MTFCGKSFRPAGVIVYLKKIKEEGVYWRDVGINLARGNGRRVVV